MPFGALPVPVIHQVVQKFVMQLEAQLSEDHSSAEFERALEDLLDRLDREIVE